MALLAARDLRTSTGRNLDLVRRETGLDPWVVKSGVFKRKLETTEQVTVSEEDELRIPYLEKLLEHRQELSYRGIDYTDIDKLIQSVCIN